eukprot:SAG31_NODE_3549_length_4134_cov_3.066171_5_plen_388_part_00
MRNEQGLYGCSYMKTPHMDALASRSLVFEHMYTGIALCAPSRTILLTSRRPDTSRVWTIAGREYWRLSGGNFTTLPQYFKEHGYVSLGVGKIFHPGQPSGGGVFGQPQIGCDVGFSWSRECLPYQNTFDEPEQPPLEGVTSGSSEYSSPAIHPFFNVTDDEMAEGQLAAAAVRLLDGIRQRRANGSDPRPFFTAVGFHRPHIPWHAPEHYYKLYDLALPVAPNQLLPSDVPDVAISNIWTKRFMDGSRCSCIDSPRFDREEGASCCGRVIEINGVPGGFDSDDNYTAFSYWDSFGDLHQMSRSDLAPHDNTTISTRDQQRIRQAYRAAMSFTDRNIGVVLGGLAAAAFADTTIVALWADHGYQVRPKTRNDASSTKRPVVKLLTAAL